MKHEFGTLLRTWRKERGLTLARGAKQWGIGKGYASGLETGKVNPPSAKKVKRIARAIGHDPTDLLRIAWIPKVPVEIKNLLSVEVPACQPVLPVPVAQGETPQAGGGSL